MEESKTGERELELVVCFKLKNNPSTKVRGTVIPGQDVPRIPPSALAQDGQVFIKLGAGFGFVTEILVKISNKNKYFAQDALVGAGVED